MYVEGGGDTRDQQLRLKTAMRAWIAAALPEGNRRPEVIACGGRQSAYEAYCLALTTHSDDICVLLVDSEAPVVRSSRWAHVRERRGDGWQAPSGVGEDALHFMSQTMEASICADPDALAAWFGPGFKADKLPARTNLEAEPKADLFRKLANASRPSKRGRYHKGRDLGVLENVAPAHVIARCPHAGAFLSALKERLVEVQSG